MEDNEKNPQREKGESKFKTKTNVAKHKKQTNSRTNEWKKERKQELAGERRVIQNKLAKEKCEEVIVWFYKMKTPHLFVSLITKYRHTYVHMYMHTQYGIHMY